MKYPVAGVIAFAAFAAVSSAQTLLESFEGTDLTPWGGSSTISASLASDGTQSAQFTAVMDRDDQTPEGSGYWGVFMDVNSASLSLFSTPLSGTATLWADFHVAGSSGTYGGVSLHLNYPGFWNTIDGVAGATANGWTTYSFELSATHAAALSNPSLGYHNIGFLLNAGIWDGSVQAATVQVNIDNIRGQAAAAPVPEPSTYAAILGLVGLVFAAWRRSRR